MIYYLIDVKQEEIPTKDIEETTQNQDVSLKLTHDDDNDVPKPVSYFSLKENILNVQERHESSPKRNSRRFKRKHNSERSITPRCNNENRQEVSNTCLAVFGLSRSLTDRSLVKFFEPFGPLRWVRILRGFKRNYGFVNFLRSEDARKVLDKHEYVTIDGVEGINVKWSWRNPDERESGIPIKRLTKLNFKRY